MDAGATLRREANDRAVLRQDTIWKARNGSLRNRGRECPAEEDSEGRLSRKMCRIKDFIKKLASGPSSGNLSTCFDPKRKLSWNRAGRMGSFDTKSRLGCPCDNRTTPKVRRNRRRILYRAHYQTALCTGGSRTRRENSATASMNCRAREGKPTYSFQ